MTISLVYTSKLEMLFQIAYLYTSGDPEQKHLFWIALLNNLLALLQMGGGVERRSLYPQQKFDKALFKPVVLKLFCSLTPDLNIKFTVDPLA